MVLHPFFPFLFFLYIPCLSIKAWLCVLRSLASWRGGSSPFVTVRTTRETFYDYIPQAKAHAGQLLPLLPFLSLSLSLSLSLYFSLSLSFVRASAITFVHCEHGTWNKRVRYPRADGYSSNQTALVALVLCTERILVSCEQQRRINFVKDLSRVLDPLATRTYDWRLW